MRRIVCGLCGLALALVTITGCDSGTGTKKNYPEAPVVTQPDMGGESTPPAETAVPAEPVPPSEATPAEPKTDEKPAEATKPEEKPAEATKPETKPEGN